MHLAIFVLSVEEFYVSLKIDLQMFLSLAKDLSGTVYKNITLNLTFCVWSAQGSFCICKTVNLPHSLSNRKSARKSNSKFAQIILSHVLLYYFKCLSFRVFYSNLQYSTQIYSNCAKL